MNNKYNVGDVLYIIWGYDQTNIDFYQVIKTTSKTITIIKINATKKLVSFDTYETEPIVNDFATFDVFNPNSEPMRKLNNQPSIKNHLLHLWDGNPMVETIAR